VVQPLHTRRNLGTIGTGDQGDTRPTLLLRAGVAVTRTLLKFLSDLVGMAIGEARRLFYEAPSNRHPVNIDYRLQTVRRAACDHTVAFTRITHRWP
jgi:hypothetical protein